MEHHQWVWAGGRKIEAEKELHLPLEEDVHERVGPSVKGDFGQRRGSSDVVGGPVLERISPKGVVTRGNLVETNSRTGKKETQGRRSRFVRRALAERGLLSIARLFLFAG